MRPLSLGKHKSEVDCLLTFLVLLALVFVVGEREPQLVVVLNRKQGLFVEPSLREVIVVHEQVSVETVNHQEPIIAVLVKKFKSTRVPLVIDWRSLRLLLYKRVLLIFLSQGVGVGVIVIIVHAFTEPIGIFSSVTVKTVTLLNLHPIQYILLQKIQKITP